MRYETAIRASEEFLAALDPAGVCARTGALWDGGKYLIPWFGNLTPLDAGEGAERVLWTHYLTSEGAGTQAGRLIAYRDLRGAGFYEPKFNERAVRPLEKCFGMRPELLEAAGAAVSGGAAGGLGDASVTLRPLPRLPITYVIWRGDDELPPAGMILFDGNASGWLPAEDLTVLASIGAYKLIAAAGRAG